MPLKWFSDQSRIKTPRLGSRRSDPGAYRAPASLKNASAAPHRRAETLGGASRRESRVVRVDADFVVLFVFLCVFRVTRVFRE